MSLSIPTTQESKDTNLANLEGQLGQTSPLADKAFLRVLAAMEALGVATPLYKYLSGDFKGIKIKAKKIDKKFKRLTLEGRIIHKIKPIVNTHYRKNES